MLKNGSRAWRPSHLITIRRAQRRGGRKACVRPGREGKGGDGRQGVRVLDVCRERKEKVAGEGEVALEKGKETAYTKL